MKYLFTGIAVLLIGGGVYWFVAIRQKIPELPSNLPTAEELERMRDIEQSSSQQNPNAVPGVGVAKKGTLTATTTDTEATSTATTTETIGATTTNEAEVEP